MTVLKRSLTLFDATALALGMALSIGPRIPNPRAFHVGGLKAIAYRSVEMSSLILNSHLSGMGVVTMKSEIGT